MSMSFCGFKSEQNSDGIEAGCRRFSHAMNLQMANNIERIPNTFNFIVL